ncbi:MAG: right-handed parallel beta-helix repeat-containing protein [Pseudobacteriovorax sp.]|nr:right-handed parallel beta-helix repeat-containing protein [Pseudobacteriovorax sp.]
MKRLRTPGTNFQTLRLDRRSLLNHSGQCFFALMLPACKSIQGQKESVRSAIGSTPVTSSGATVVTSGESDDSPVSFDQIEAQAGRGSVEVPPDYVSPRDFGASESGTANVQAFRDAAAEARSTGKPLLIDQRYELGNLLDWNLTNVTLVGSEQAQIVVKAMSILGIGFHIKNILFVTLRGKGSMITVYGSDALIQACEFRKDGGEAAQALEADRQSPLLGLGFKGDFSGVKSPTHLHSGFSTSTNLQVMSCRFYSAGTAIVMGSVNHRVSECVFKEVANAVVLTASAREIEIRNCLMRDFVGSTDENNSAIIAIRSVRKLKIVGNSIRGAKGNGLFLEASDVIISKNIISSSALSGIYVLSQNRQHYLYPEEEVGQSQHMVNGHFHQHDILIYQNEVSSSAGAGSQPDHGAITIAEGVQIFVVRGNRILGSGELGIHMVSRLYADSGVWNNITLHSNEFLGEYSFPIRFLEQGQSMISISSNRFVCFAGPLHFASVDGLKLIKNLFSEFQASVPYKVKLERITAKVIDANESLDSVLLDGQSFAV